jgi:hypothetical protein
MAVATKSEGYWRPASSLAIAPALALRGLLPCPRRQTAGVLHAVLPLMGVGLPWPDHTTLARRHATGAVRRPGRRVAPGPLALSVDSSGLQGCGPGEWQPQKHGEKLHKRWKTLHMGVDNHGQLIASAGTDGQDQDPAQVPDRWAPIGRESARFLGDGLYDQGPLYTAVEHQAPGASVILPPRKDAGVSPTGAPSPPPRDRHIVTLESKGRCAGKRTSGYDRQRHAAQAFARDNRPFGGRWQAKREAAQEREASLTCAWRNWRRECGRPPSSPVS